MGGLCRPPGGPATAMRRTAPGRRQLHSVIAGRRRPRRLYRGFTVRGGWALRFGASLRTATLKSSSPMSSPLSEPATEDLPASRPVPSRRRRWLGSLLALGLVAALAGGAWYLIK